MKCWYHLYFIGPPLGERDNARSNLEGIKLTYKTEMTKNENQILPTGQIDVIQKHY